MQKTIFLLLAVLACSFNLNPVQPTKKPPVFSKVFTPNGDGKDDVFQIQHLEEYPDNELVICTRWGNEVYRASPYKGDWKGNCNLCKENADKLGSGTYFYVFKDKETGVKYNGYLEMIF